jgi:hypothetical protein
MRNLVLRDRCASTYNAYIVARLGTAEDARRSPSRGQPVCTLSARYRLDGSSRPVGLGWYNKRIKSKTTNRVRPLI